MPAPQRSSYPKYSSPEPPRLATVYAGPQRSPSSKYPPPGPPRPAPGPRTRIGVPPNQITIPREPRRRLRAQRRRRRRGTTTFLVFLCANTGTFRDSTENLLLWLTVVCVCVMSFAGFSQWSGAIVFLFANQSTRDTGLAGESPNRPR